MDITKEQLGRHSPLGFAQYAWPKRKHGFWYKAHKTTLRVNRAILDLHNPDTPSRVLVISQPPRTGKSILVSRIHPAWYKCRYPDNNLLITGYSSDLTADFTLEARELTKEFGSKLFGVKVDPNLRKKDDWKLKGGGRCRSASILGQITGYGFNHITIDDPYSNYQDAHSSTIRGKVWHEVGSTLDTRMEGLHPTQFICQTRWHRLDLAGRYVSMAENGDESIVAINMPAIAEEDMVDESGADFAKKGELLFPWQWDHNKLETWRKKHGEYMYQALFQGNPTTPEGTYWEEALFADCRFNDWPQEKYLIVAIDPAHGSEVNTGCDAAIVAMSTNVGSVYHIDARLDRAGPVVTVANLEEFINGLPRVPDAICIEQNAMQTEMSNRILQMTHRRGWDIEIFGIPIHRDLGPLIGTVKDKDTKIQTLDPFIREDQFRFKSGSFGASQIIEQLKAYGADRSGKVDGLDGLEIATEMFSNLWKGSITLRRKKERSIIR